MPLVPARLISPCYEYLESQGVESTAIFSDTGLNHRRIRDPETGLEWGEFTRLLSRIVWISGKTDPFAPAMKKRWQKASAWQRFWNGSSSAEDLAHQIQTFLRVPGDSALQIDILHANWNRLVLHVEISDGCRSDQNVFALIRAFFSVFPSAMGLPLVNLEAMEGSRDATFSFQVEPPWTHRLTRGLRTRWMLLFRGEKWAEHLQRQQRELQDSLDETLQAHSRTRTLNLVGLDLAECTDLEELADGLARSLNAHLLATGISLSIDESEPSHAPPTIISRGIPSTHHHKVVLFTASGPVGRLSIWVENEAFHPDLLEQLAPWIAIAVQNIRAIQTIRRQKEQLAVDYEQAKEAAQIQGRLERQLLQTQKLESLGIMARGVAHDFNNLLVGIMSQAQLAQQTLSNESPGHAHLNQILQTSRQATELTEQMLTYSGMGRLRAENSNLTELVRDMAELLHASTPKKVLLDFDLDANLPMADLDSKRFQQVILNLVQNGADAIGNRAGKVTVRTRRVQPEDILNESEVFTNRLPRGEAILLEVADTGRELSRKARGQIFDPFFNNQGPARGLGLATVLGIVRTHRGALCLRSQPGEGSIFRVLLPISMQPALADSQSSTPTWTHQGTVLIVDDEDVVRESLREMLVLMGFSPWVAVDGEQALSTYESARSRLQALILDWNMPGLSGVEVILKIREEDPDIPVILTSAYHPDEQILALRSSGNLSFLRKPFTMEELRTALAQRLCHKQRA